MITVMIRTILLRSLVLAEGTHSRVNRSFSSRGGSQVDSLAAEAGVEAVAVAEAVTSSISNGAHNCYMDCHQCGDLSERERVEEFARSVDFYSHMLSACPVPEDALLLPAKIYLLLFLTSACSRQSSRRYRLSTLALDLPSSYVVRTMSSS